MTRFDRAAEVVLRAVAEDTDITEAEMLATTSRRDIVDARQMATYILLSKGFTTERVAERMHISRRYAQYIAATFPQKAKYDRFLRKSFDRVCKSLGA